MDKVGPHHIKKEERSASLTLTRGEDLTPKLLTKLREESLHSTSPKEALMSAISASFQDLSQLGETEGASNDEDGLGLAPELVVEVNSVLSKLMNSLNENLDPELIPTIKDLQATLNLKKKRAELESRFRRQCPPIDSSSSSKVPWKIRAARKRAIKHHTTGMTKDEFQLIKNSLQESAKLFTSIPTQGYALSRNKSESAIRSHHRNVIPENFSSQPFQKDLKCALGKDQKTHTLPFVTNGSDLRTSDTGYASDVCDYNINSSFNDSMNKSSSSQDKDSDKEPSSTLQSNEKISKTCEKPPRRSVKYNSGSAVKARIDRRKRMRHANAIDNPHGSLSDQESSMIEDNDEEEDDDEKNDAHKVSMNGCNSSEEAPCNGGDKSGGDSDSKTQPKTSYNSSSSELTPETNRRKNWNSRFSNIKNAFVSEEEIFQKSRSPSINRDNNNVNMNVVAPRGKKADDKYMNIVVQARLENNRSRRSLNRSNSKNDHRASGLNINYNNTSKSASSQNLSITNNISSSKSKQPTPNRDAAPKSPPRLSKSLPKESRAEAMGLEPSNKNKNDMDYQEYMNIISRVRRTKESTRVRTEQVRLASMYAQEQRRQEEIKREEERLKLEREKVQKDLERQKQEDEQTLESQKVQESKNTDLVPSSGQKANSPPPSAPPQETVKSASKSSDSSLLINSPISLNSSPNQSGKSTSKLYEKTIAQLVEQARLDIMSKEQKRQQELREEQVKAEQEKLERLRQEQIRQEKEREEIHRLEYERLKQIQEEQRKLDEERRRQQERIRLEQVRLEEERKRQETLQAERNAEYNRQRLDMEAQNVSLPQETRAKLLMSPTGTSTTPLVALTSTHNQVFDHLSPEEKIIQKRLSDQETLRKSHKAEESKIRQEKLKLIQQEEMLISRQEEMLRQVEAERQNLMKQEQLIRSRQQGRLTQVRQEKMLLEKQEEMLQMRERQLIEERIRQKKLRMEQKSLREQEEVIRKRQEQISKELMGEISIEPSTKAVAFDGAPQPDIMGYSSSQSNDSAIKMNGEEDEDDTLDEESETEEFYESTVEVKQKSTSVPTSVRTVGLANTDKPWAPITPYLSTYERPGAQTNPTPPSEMFMDDEKSFFKPGIITSPESLRTSSTLITTPDETSLQLSLDSNPMNTPPCVPPLPYDECFQPVQPEDPPSVISYDSLFENLPPVRPSSPRRSLIDTSLPGTSKIFPHENKLSPRIGGPGSAFKPYSSSENLHDPTLFSTALPDSTKLLLPPAYPSVSLGSIPKKSPVVYNKVKELRKPIRAPFSTTDTEPEMKECHFPPEKNKRTVIKQHPYKPSYSTSETEDEVYLSRKTKWSRHHHHHQNHGPKNSGPSWDPFQVASPPQITQKPVGIIQKPKPQHQYYPSTITLGSLEAPIPSATVSESLYQPVIIERGAQISAQYPPHSFNNLVSSTSTSLPTQPVIGIKPDNLPSLQSPPRGTTLHPIEMKPAQAIVLPTKNIQTSFQTNNLQSKIESTLPPPPPPLPPIGVSLPNGGNPNQISLKTDHKTTNLTSSENKNSSMKDAPSNNNNIYFPPVKDSNGNLMFEPSKVIRQSSFSNLPSTSTVPVHEALPRQSSFNSVPSIDRLPLKDNERKLSSVVRTEPERDSHPKKTTQLQEELEKKLEERKISSEMRSKEDFGQNAVVPLTVVEMSIKGQKKVSEENRDAEKKKALHHKIINEVVSFKKDNDGIKKKTVVPRNNLTITAMEIMTRKEIKTCEMEERLMREKYGQHQPENFPEPSKKNITKVNKPPTNNNNSNSSSKPPHQVPPPTIILKKEPKRLDPEEIQARKSSSEKQPESIIEHKREARVISASNVITRSNNGVVEKKKEEYIENLSKSSSAEDMEDLRAAKIKREKVKKAAERFEKTASPVVGSKDQTGDKLPWNDETTPSLGKPKPGILRRRETFRKNGYALRMSKSSDSITASKMMSRNTSGLRINQYNGPDSDSSSDVYHKTRDEIRKILTIAKQSSVTERIKIFNNQILGDVKPLDEDDRDRKAEAIKKEILAAKMSVFEENGDFTDSRRSSLQIPKKNPSSESRLRINQPQGSNASKQKIGRKLSEPALNGSVQSRIENYYMGAKSSGKKEPKLIMNSNTHSIYAQSATDYSATEEETEFRGNGPPMDYLQVPNSSNSAVNSKKRGLRRSKSFASSGQYECVLSDEEVDEKTRQMMAFFNTSPSSNSNTDSQYIRVVSDESTKPLKGVLKTRQQSISEEIIGDEDLGNVEDIFERLLVENSVEEVCLGGTRISSGNNSNQSGGIRVVKNSSSASSVMDGIRGSEHLSPSALPPTSHGKRITLHQQHRTSSRSQSSWGALGSSHEHLSSSPTQSEYESCDPWEDY